MNRLTVELCIKSIGDKIIFLLMLQSNVVYLNRNPTIIICNDVSISVKRYELDDINNNKNYYRRMDNIRIRSFTFKVIQARKVIF